MEDTRGVECFWSDPKTHPQCTHGPTLLFGKHENGKLEQFYACAACRNRKDCNFYLKHGSQLTKEKKAFWEKERKKFASRYHHRKLYLRHNEIASERSSERCYCHDCERLFSRPEMSKHENHKVIVGLTEHQMKHPTEILKPLEDSKKEAQYFFSTKTTRDIVEMLSKLGAKSVLCVGAPRIHEYVTENCQDEMASLLLDFDGRFHNFFGPLAYCWYNLLNHHFFEENAASTFKDFLTQNGGQDVYLICDPPFGCRVEALSQTIRKISTLHAKWNKMEESLKILFVFPYFMEPIMKRKSTPASITGGLKDLEMSDYKVDYENHPLFAKREKGDKELPSLIRIFTNVPLKLLQLPQSEGYKYCKRCDKWVSQENRHCKKCKACTSKNGNRYRHCTSCERCVKPTWKHCKNCNRCTSEVHPCGQKPKVNGRCFSCNEIGHTQRECRGIVTTHEADEDLNAVTKEVLREAKLVKSKSRKRKQPNAGTTTVRDESKKSKKR